MQYCGHILTQKVILQFINQLNILTGYFITVKKKNEQKPHQTHYNLNYFTAHVHY